jgi:hypothetical protein
MKIDAPPLTPARRGFAIIWLVLPAAMMVVTAVYHSKRGEKNVIGPLLALDAPLMRFRDLDSRWWIGRISCLSVTAAKYASDN